MGFSHCYIRVHSVQAEDVMIMTCSQVLAGQNVEGESKLEEQDEAQLQEEDICLFINNEQQYVNDVDFSKYVSELLSECVPPVLHHLAEFKDHPYEEIVVINDDEALNLNEMEMQSPTCLESERRDSMDVEVTEAKVCTEGCK